MTDIYDFNKIAHRIRETRKECGISQDKVAKTCHNSRATVIKWEQGKTMPELDSMLTMCNMFNCELGYLLGEEGYARTGRVVTDIKEQIGLSDEAIIKLRNTKSNAKGDFHNTLKYIFSDDIPIIQFLLEHEETELVKVKIDKYIYHMDKVKLFEKLVDIKNMPQLNPLVNDITNYLFSIYAYLLWENIPVIETDINGKPLNELFTNEDIRTEELTICLHTLKQSEHSDNFTIRELNEKEKLAFTYYISDEVMDIMKDPNGLIHKYLLKDEFQKLLNEYIKYFHSHTKQQGLFQNWYIDGVSDE